MIRFWPCILLLSCAQPALAGERDATSYGPMKRGGGLMLARSYGYRDDVAKDGSWRIDAATRGGDALDMAMYRAAERARAEGYRYVFFLGGSSVRSPGYNGASVYARPSREAVAPVGCRSKRQGSCYTADVAEVMRVLGGPGGAQPGVAIVDHLDRFGREVRVSGYGTGAVAAPAGMVVPRSSVATITDGRLLISGSRDAIEKRAGVGAPTPVPVAQPAATPAAVPVTVAAFVPVRRLQPSEAEQRFGQALRANQPIRGREPRLGWTISD